MKQTLKSIMKRIQFRIYKGEKYYVAECIDLPIVTQGRTLDEVVENIKEALSLHLEGEDLEELEISPDFSVLVNLELEYAKAQEFLAGRKVVKILSKFGFEVLSLNACTSTSESIA